MKNSIYLLISSVFIFGCAEERLHKLVPKFDVQSKSHIDESAIYLYVPSTGEVSRTTRLTRPHIQGQERLVRLKFEKKELVAYQIEKDKRFEENIANAKPVFRIPIQHLDYRESRDPFGETTNIEETNQEIDWKQRRYFEPQPENFKFIDVNTIPEALENLFGGPCYKNTGEKVLNFDLDSEALNIVIEKSYQGDLSCPQSVTFDDLTDLSFNEINHHSLIKLDSIASKDYEKIEYSRAWEGSFGFFENSDHDIDSTLNPTQSTEKYYLNRWNPNRKTIKYHLDPAFAKPENKGLLEATVLGFERLNAALKKAEVDLVLQYDIAQPNVRSGDLRYSMIVMVEDPIASGLLGYGPSVKNPQTGEILQARTVMYPGVMKQIIRRAYDEAVKLSKLKAAAPASSELDEISQKVNTFARRRAVAVPRQWTTYKGDLSALRVEAPQPADANATDPNDTSAADPDAASFVNDVGLSIGKLVSLTKNFFQKTSKKSLFQIYQNQQEKNLHSDYDHEREYLSRNNFFMASDSLVKDLTDLVLLEEVNKIGEGQPWEKLDPKAQKEILDLTLPYVWIPTFIHEVGHNLGLRHNFNGSEDEANFYSKEELAALGVQSEFGSPYSSMMEYSKSEIKGLPVPGKYDVAALRFGYTQKVEVRNGDQVEIVEVKDQQPDDLELVEYQYCTDETVSLNPTCNRFDEGVGYVGVAESMIDSYKDFYGLRNFRNDRRDFSAFSDWGYARGTASRFRSMRIFYERLVDIMVNFDLKTDRLESIEWLSEMNEATKLIANFFMDVVAEPDLSCVISREGNVIDIMPYTALAKIVFVPEAKDCFGLQSGLAGGFSITAQGGRHLKNVKHRDNPNNFADQIDIRGVWIDKILALNSLTQRRLGEFSFDEHTVSFLDHPEIGEEVHNFVKNIFVDNISRSFKFKTENQEEFDVLLPHKFSDANYDLPRPLSTRVYRALGIKTQKQSLNDLFAQILADNLNEGSLSYEVESLKESLRLYSELPRDGRSLDDFVSVKMGGQLYFASEDNEVAAGIILDTQIREAYEKIDRARIIEIGTSMETGDALDPKTITADDQAVIDLGYANLIRFLRGEMVDVATSQRLLSPLIQLTEKIKN